MDKLFLTLLRRLLSLMALAILGGVVGATLVRYSPGYGVDERELDPRLSQSSVDAIRAQHGREGNMFRYYAEYLRGAAHGNLGNSESLQRPISEILRERFPVTIRSVLAGVITASLAALALCLWGVAAKGWLFELLSTTATGFLLSLPSAVVAMLFVYLRAPVFLAIALVTFPKLFRFARNLLSNACGQPHVLGARARGIGQTRIVLHHMILPTAPALLALFGVSITLAFGAAIPIETLCDSAGIGQLAWYAAINRDLPLIVTLTWLVAMLTVASNWMADYAGNLAARAA